MPNARTANGATKTPAAEEKQAGRGKRRQLREVKGADFKLWPGDQETFPFEIAGLFRGFSRGKFGPEANFKIEREGTGLIETWNAPDILHDRLSNVPVGTYIEVALLGWITTGSGREAMEFRVLADMPEATPGFVRETEK